MPRNTCWCNFQRLGKNVNHNPILPHSWYITGFLTSVTRWVPYVEQELLTLPDHLNSSIVLVGFVLLELWFSVYCFFKSSFITLLFFVWAVALCPSICGFWLLLWDLQIILTCIFLQFCITATSQSATSYTAVYTGVGSFVVTALMSVIIVQATLRYGFIFYLLSFCPCIIPDNKVWH
jgi:hypothetical protein